MAKSRIAARLARKWRSNPQATVRAVVHTLADPNEAEALLTERGLTVEHRYKLIPALAVSGKAQDALDLAQEDWITSIEEDQQVHASKG
jgi:hypothetical protein